MINFKNNIKLLKQNSYLIYIALGLVVLSFIIDGYWPGKQSLRGVQRIVQADIQRKEKDFKNFCNDTSLHTALIQKRESNVDAEEITAKKYGIFIYTKDENGINKLKFWNTQVVLPDTNLISQKDSSQLSKLSNGYYVFEKKTINANGIVYTVAALFPVKKQYYINNLHLKNSFAAVDDVEDNFDINEKTDGAVIINNAGVKLFSIKPIGQSNIPYNNIFAVWLRITATLLLFIVLNFAAKDYIRKKGLAAGYFSFFLTIFILRFISYYIPVPVDFKQFALFSPAIYGTNFILRSLGDLFINVLLVQWLIFFLRQQIQHRTLPATDNAVRRLVFLTLAGIIILISTITAGFIIKSLVADSQISFDVINFFTLNRYSVIGFAILCSIASSYFLLVQIIIQLIRPILKGDFFAFGIIISVQCLLAALYFSGGLYFSYYFLLMVWMIFFLYLMQYKDLSIFTSKIISSKFIFWIFFLSASITTVIVLQNKRKELENRKHFAENIANKTDPSGERMMNITLTDFRNDFLPDIFSRFYNEKENHFIKDSLIGENFSGYLNKYDTKIYTFDTLGLPLHNDDSTSYNTLNAILETQAKPTSIPGLLYYDVSFDIFNYINKKTIVNRDSIFLGYVFILSRPKNYKSDALYPQLFTKSSTAIENSPVYAYAIYSDKNLVNSFNDYPFPTVLTSDQVFYTDFTERNKNNYSELWYKAGPGKLIVIAKPDHLFVEFVTLFAYLFCGFLLLVGFINVLNIFIKSRFQYHKIKLLMHFTIRNQVHGTIIAISVISFLIIGVTTILFFISRYHKNNREKLSKTISVMESAVRTSIDTFYLKNEAHFVSDMSASGRLNDEVNKIAEVHSADINIYSIDGNLLASSLPLPYAKGILSTVMDPVAYYHLNVLKDVQYFQEQYAGSLKYLNNYVPVRNKNGEEFAYLNIPYFESENKLQEEISNFLVTIINLNAFIFLIAGIIAFFITNRITRSFFFISAKMKEVNIGKVNEKISWNRKDEIGELVKEYNKMVMKLEESAEKLARNEREGAWREMARQVAHEIKNPLTPMKLNLQYLQMAIENDAPNVKQLSIYVSATVVEQIDNLSKIASDFAQFANINHNNNEVFNINDSIQPIVSLYSADGKVVINFSTSGDKMNVKADKVQINRLFTNLVQNAVQSITADKHPVIDIESSVKDKKILVSVKDNGSGIPEIMKSKIFIPNFTTKTSGTGLGLAMCKGIVEKIQGRIWFETEEGKGTIFYVEFPEAD